MWRHKKFKIALQPAEPLLPDSLLPEKNTEFGEKNHKALLTYHPQQGTSGKHT